MKKILISAVAIATLAASSVAAAQGYNRGYNNNRGYDNSAAWNSAAIGLTGMVAGAVISGVMQNNANAAAQGYAQPGYGYAPPPVYAQPGYGYAPPPVVNPYYYPQAQACVTQRAPVFNAYGQITEFVQYCANRAR
jgi:hypothetical protein